MNKKVWRGVVLVLAAAIVGTGAYYFFKDGTRSSEPTPTPAPAAFDPLNAAYIIDGQSVALVNGRAESPAAPGSASKIETMAFGQPVSGDLNGDGTPDAALFLVQNSGGSGTFYYAAAAINASGTAQGTNAVLLGDRIAPDTIQIQDGHIIANFADRKPGEPMTATPSVGVSEYLIYDGSMLTVFAPGAGPGDPCGGNLANAATCQTGYYCAPGASGPSHGPFGDVGGTCVKN